MVFNGLYFISPPQYLTKKALKTHVFKAFLVKILRGLFLVIIDNRNNRTAWRNGICVTTCDVSV